MARSTGSRWARLRLLLSLLAVAAFLFLMPARFTAPLRVLFTEVTGPVETPLYEASGRALSASGTLTEMFMREDRERALARELENLRNRNARLQDELLRRQMRLDDIEKLEIERFDFRALNAPVSAYDTSATSRSIAVRAGTSDGVQKGQAAAAFGAMVGIVREVGPYQCRVRLITDPRSVVPCRLPQTRALCLVVGTGTDTCRVEWVERDAFIEKDEVLSATSLEVEPAPGLMLPDGLPVVTVEAVAPDEMRPLFYKVDAAPRVNLTRLEEVDILIPEEPGPD